MALKTQIVSSPFFLTSHCIILKSKKVYKNHFTHLEILNVSILKLHPSGNFPWSWLPADLFASVLTVSINVDTQGTTRLFYFQIRALALRYSCFKINQLQQSLTASTKVLYVDAHGLEGNGMKLFLSHRFVCLRWAASYSCCQIFLYIFLYVEPQCTGSFFFSAPVYLRTDSLIFTIKALVLRYIEGLKVINHLLSLFLFLLSSDPTSPPPNKKGRWTHHYNLPLFAESPAANINGVLE